MLGAHAGTRARARCAESCAGVCARAPCRRDERRAAGGDPRRVAALDAREPATRAWSERATCRDSSRQRRLELERQLVEGEAPYAGLEKQLHAFLEQRLAVERELGDARRTSKTPKPTCGSRMGAAESRGRRGVRALCARRDQSRHAGNARAARVARRTVCRNAVRPRRGHWSRCPRTRPSSSGSQQLAEVTERIERLGAVNLAAIDEFKEQSERKEYLDRQFADLYRCAEHARTGDPQDRQGDPRALPGHVRPHQRRAQGKLPAPVRRRTRPIWSWPAMTC